MERIRVGKYGRAFFGPVGKCIYCGSDGGDKGLRSEHVFPYFIGGNVELLKASCADCEKITSFIDGHCANKVFRSFRTHKGIQTRRPKNRPTHFDIEYLTDQGWITRSIPVDDAPYILPLPHFKMPGFLDKRAPTDGIETPTFDLLTISDVRKRAEKFQQPGESEWRIPMPPFDPAVCARFVAKIALAGAVAILKYDASQSPLGAIVRGIDNRIGFFVGCEGQATEGIAFTESPPILDGKDHNEIGFVYWRNDVTAHTILGAEIQFLVKHGSTTRYVAVVGPAMPNSVETYVQSPRR